MSMTKEAARALYRKNSRKQCRHCKVRKVSKPKGLCYGCGTNPAICSLYPCYAVKVNNRGHAVGNVNPPLPPERTGAPPGSPRRVLVMGERMKAGFAPLHPDDSKDWEEATHEDRAEFAAQFTNGFGKRSTRADLDRLHGEGEDVEC